MMGREREMTAWRSGPLIQNGFNGNLPPNPMAKAGQPRWQAKEGLSPQPCHSAALGHGPLPRTLIRNWGFVGRDVEEHHDEEHLAEGELAVAPPLPRGRESVVTFPVLKEFGKVVETAE